MPDITKLEFYRNGFALEPSQNGKEKTILIIPPKNKDKNRLFCSCSRGKRPNCHHASNIELLHEQYTANLSNISPAKDFENSPFYKIFTPISQSFPCFVQSSSYLENKKEQSVEISIGDCKYITYKSDKRSMARLLSRIDKKCEGDDPRTRFSFINAIRPFVLTEMERTLYDAGSKTCKLQDEESLWYRLAYHLYREFDVSKTKFKLSYKKRIGLFTLAVSSKGNSSSMELQIPRKSVSNLMKMVTPYLKKDDKIPVNKKGKEIFFLIEEEQKSKNLFIVPVVSMGTVNKERYFELQEKFMNGSHAYEPETKEFLTFTHDSLKILGSKFYSRKKMKQKDLSKYLEKNMNIFTVDSEEDTNTGDMQVDLFKSNYTTNIKRIIQPPVITCFDSVEIDPIAFEKEWVTANINYKCGEYSVPLKGLLAAQKNKDRFLFTGNALVDCHNKEISNICIGMGAVINDKHIKMHRASLLHFSSDDNTLNVTFKEGSPLQNTINNLTDLIPQKPYEPLKNILFTLRDYQEIGVKWLLSLFDNNLGGLLCDDMGLGKTHQAISLFIALIQQRGVNGPFLVVCPTTLLGHWENILEKFAPDFNVLTFHGFNRKETIEDDTFDILLTSYGIVRNDIEILANQTFSTAFFDEIQHCKNPNSGAFKAMIQLNATAKFGLTGTPIENSVADLKALFDIVMPGYLGSDRMFAAQFVEPLELYGNKNVSIKLRQLVSPFILRRLKSSVLTELPQKIETTIPCYLSFQQSTLYEEAISVRGTALLNTLRDEDKQVPYMHVFALLNILKKICNHEAMVYNDPENYKKYSSNKFDAFKEILNESIDSGQKVVIFTQYLAMVRIFEKYLKEINIPSVTLTGKTKNRKKVINTFNNDPICKVFIGSLKAGGVGIDLIGGSVVIHYDRWWNAAKEEQATDRVHRMGQKRGVQVFKLVTEGTIEDRIAIIIDKKKELIELTLEEDAAKSEKIFTREELINLLEYRKNSISK